MMSTLHTGTMGVNGVSNKRPTPNWANLREALWERSHGRCEVSGWPLDQDTFDAHHRRNKGMGGTYRLDTDTLPNLLALHPRVHNGGPGSVHDRRVASEANGWLVPKLSAFVLSTIPVAVWAGPGARRYVLLTDRGGYVDVTGVVPASMNEFGW